MSEQEIEDRIEEMTYCWFQEAEELCAGSLEASTLVLACVLQLARCVLEWQPEEYRDEMRAKALRILAVGGTSTLHLTLTTIMGKPQ